MATFCTRSNFVPALVTCAMACLVGVMEAGAADSAAPGGSAPEATICANVAFDMDRPLHTMAGGIGASWHAMGPHAIYYPDLIGRDNRTCKGSAYGGNPPLSTAYAGAWADLLRHARWLGLDFIRVEVALEMWEPEHGQFSWENDEDPRVTAAAAIVPAFCDVTGYLHDCAGGWPHMMRGADSRHRTPAKIATTRSYDTVNLARRVRPVFVALGYSDENCPPTSVFSSYNKLTGPKQLLVAPEMGHAVFPEIDERVRA